MSNINTETNKDLHAVCDVAVFTQIFRGLAIMIGRLSETDQADVIELLSAASQAITKEDLDEADETIREILRPKKGSVMPMIPLGRPARLKKWSLFVGSRIRDYRKTANLTQAQLAEKAGIQQAHISKIENGEISPTRMTIEKIAAAMGLPLGSLDPTT